MPVVSVDKPPLCWVGQCWWGLQWLAGAQRVAEFFALRVITTQRWVVAGTERANSCMASEALHFCGSANASCSSICVRAPIWRVMRIIRLYADIMLRSR